jgi:hypothetical protein
MVLPDYALAQRISRPIQVNESEVDSRLATIIVRRRSQSQVIQCYNYIPGLTRLRRAKLMFTPFKLTLKNLKKTQAKAAKIARFRQLQRVGKALCAVAATPTPTPPTATPPPNVGTPTPTPTPRPPRFDSNGDVTEAGRVAFGIPDGLPANQAMGQAILVNTCLDCHDERGHFYTFQALRERTSAPEMGFGPDLIPGFPQLWLPDESLAHLVAWLNRFDP